MVPFSRCKKAELTDPVTGQKVTAGVSISPLDSLMVAVPLTCKIETGKPIKIQFFDPALGVVTCRCVLTAPLSPGDKRFVVYRCKVLEQLSQNQRREDIKVPLDIHVEVIHDDSGMRASAVLRNISASGVYLVTTLTIKPKDCLSFVFRKTDSPIPLTAEVLRVEGRPDLGGIGYGCRFVRLSPGYESQLRSYVFKEERRLFKSDRS